MLFFKFVKTSGMNGQDILTLYKTGLINSFKCLSVGISGAQIVSTAHQLPKIQFELKN